MKKSPESGQNFVGGPYTSIGPLDISDIELWGTPTIGDERVSIEYGMELRRRYERTHPNEPHMSREVLEELIESAGGPRVPAEHEAALLRIYRAEHPDDDAALSPTDAGAPTDPR